MWDVSPDVSGSTAMAGKKWSTELLTGSIGMRAWSDQCRPSFDVLNMMSLCEQGRSEDRNVPGKQPGQDRPAGGPDHSPSHEERQSRSARLGQRPIRQQSHDNDVRVQVPKFVPDALA
jgi:hypothetical protein